MRRIFAINVCLYLTILPVSPIEAQIVTGTTVTTGADGSVTQTQTTTSSGPAASKTEADALSAQIGAATAAFPSSGISPTTSISSGGGTEEGNLLNAIATKSAARYLTDIAIKDKENVLIFVGNSAAPDVSAWMYFREQTSRLLENLQTHEKNSETQCIRPKRPFIRISFCRQLRHWQLRRTCFPTPILAIKWPEFLSRPTTTCLMSLF